MASILVPFRVSTGRRGVATRGTSAFVWKGTEVYPWIKKGLRDVKRRLREMERLEASGKYRKGYFSRPFQELDFFIEKIALDRRRIAGEADFFIKLATPQRQRTRQVLLAHGVPIETPIEDLKNGLELFAAEGFRQIPERGRNMDAIKRQIAVIVLKMHEVGVTHNHLHLGNFVINQEQRLKLIDLSRAKLYVSKPRTKREFLQRFARDIFFIARDLAHLGAEYRLPSDSQRLHSAIQLEIQRILSSYKQNFSATPEEVREEFSTQERRAIDKRVKKF